MNNPYASIQSKTFVNTVWAIDEVVNTWISNQMMEFEDFRVVHIDNLLYGNQICRCVTYKIGPKD